MAGPVENRDLYRKFGISVGIAFLLLTSFLWWKGLHNACLISGVLGGLLLAGGLAAPVLLKWPYRGWMKFAAAAAWFNTRLLLALVFYLLITPMGLLLRLLNKRPLAVGFDKKRESYWIARGKNPYDPSRSEKHF